MLFFWQYNRTRRSVALDIDEQSDVERLIDLLDRADIFLESTAPGTLSRLGLEVSPYEVVIP